MGLAVDLANLYTPREAVALYNRNKIKFNPSSYTLKENLILNKDLESLADEHIFTFSHGTEVHLIKSIHNSGYACKANVTSKIPINSVFTTRHVGLAEFAAIKEYNLSIALDYLRDYCKIKANDLKGSPVMDAIVRMLIALDSDESCAKEMFWLITQLSNVSYSDLHSFNPLKKALESQAQELPVLCEYTPIQLMCNCVPDVSYSTDDTTGDMRIATLYKAYYYTLELLWAYLRLNDINLQRALIWAIENAGGADFISNGLYYIVNGGLDIPGEIMAMVSIENPADRFAAYQEYAAKEDLNVLKWAMAEAQAPECKPMNPVTAMLIGYAESCAVTHYRVNTIRILYTYCKENGLLSNEPEDITTPLEGIAGMFAAAMSGAEDSKNKNLMDLDKGSKAPASGVPSSSKYNGNDAIFEALDQLQADFKSDRYEFHVRDVRVTDASAKPTYDTICSKVSLLNKALINRIKAIKTYNTGGKNPGMPSGKLDRKAMYRYKYDPNIFYDNTYKVLESDLAFGIILDISGSMCGKGITNGKTTMIVLHETLKALGINHSIIGHTARNGDYTCDIERYQAFREDKTYTVCKNYALVELQAQDENCDSGALYYMEKALERVKNKDKIVLIFSDGYPTACTGVDLIEQVKKMEKKGIKVIGIGIDFPSISQYYTDYANGRNLKDMLDIVSNILQEYILKKKDT